MLPVDRLSHLQYLGLEVGYSDIKLAMNDIKPSSPVGSGSVYSMTMKLYLETQVLKALLNN